MSDIAPVTAINDLGCDFVCVFYPEESDVAWTKNDLELARRILDIFKRMSTTNASLAKIKKAA